jgi:hypothetical protein
MAVQLSRLIRIPVQIPIHIRKSVARISKKFHFALAIIYGNMLQYLHNNTVVWRGGKSALKLERERSQQCWIHKSCAAVARPRPATATGKPLDLAQAKAAARSLDFAQA